MPVRSKLWKLAQRPTGREKIRAALVAAEGAIPDAARALGVSHSTLRAALHGAHPYLAELASLARRQTVGQRRGDLTDEAIEDALIHSEGRIREAARALDVPVSTLYSRRHRNK